MTIPIKIREPSLGGEPDYAKALYCDPPSHDFCVWLIIAELMRREMSAGIPLQVHLLLDKDQLGYADFGPFSLSSGKFYESKVPKAYSDTMISNVFRPAMEMIGATEVKDLPPKAELETYVEYDYHIGHLVDAGRAGFTPPHWQPPQWARDEVTAHLKGERPVVITLREINHQPERNSQLTAWLRFAHSIKKQHPVLFVRDTWKMGEPLGVPTYRRASENAYIRAALCEYALVNMHVCTGPFVWSQFSPYPYITFKQLVPALPEWAHGQAQGWRDQDHMEIGDQYPWANPLQVFTWNDDTYENLCGEFDLWLKALKAATASTSTSSAVPASAGTDGPIATPGSLPSNTESSAAPPIPYSSRS